MFVAVVFRYIFGLIGEVRCAVALFYVSEKGKVETLVKIFENQIMRFSDDVVGFIGGLKL